MSSVDVIIPCYKYGHLLQECVESVLSQQSVDLRVLILDDASPDNTSTVCMALTKRDPRVEFRRHAANRGHIATYNEGLDWAESDYTLLLSADDMLTPGALERAASLMDSNPEVGFTFGRQIKIFKGQVLEDITPPSVSHTWRIMSGHDFLKLTIRHPHNPVPTPTAVVRTGLQKRLGGYREGLPHSGDLEMWLRFAAHAPVGILDAHQAYYRIHGQSMSCFYPGRAELVQRRAAFETLFRDYGEKLANREEMELSLYNNLAMNVIWDASRAFDRGDISTCEELFEFAVETCPSIRSKLCWTRLTLKRWLGPTVWSVFRPLVDSLRRANENLMQNLSKNSHLSDT